LFSKGDKWKIKLAIGDSEISKFNADPSFKYMVYV